jgi:hypothetical protein
MVHGDEVLLRLVAGGGDVVVPFCGMTLRDKYDVLTHEAAIEGNGLRRSLTERTGATGGFTTPLTLGTAPAILGVMFGDVKAKSFVSETRNLYRTQIDLCAADIAGRFALIEQCGNTTKEYPDCVCSGFELRIRRGEAVKAHLDIDSNRPMSSEQLAMSNDEGNGKKEKGKKAVGQDGGERFKGAVVRYLVDGVYFDNIYAATLSVKKEGGCKTQLILNRVMEKTDLPEHITFLHIPLVLFREKYEERSFGRFMIILNDLFLISDGTEVNTADAVIGGLRYVVAGTVMAEVYHER